MSRTASTPVYDIDTTVKLGAATVIQLDTIISLCVNVIFVDLQCIHFFSFTCVILHFNNHIINKSHMICSQHNYVLVLGVWSLLRQTGMGNSPWQFEAVHRTTLVSLSLGNFGRESYLVHR